MIFRRIIKTMIKHARSKRGFTLIEVMLCSAILIVATTASLQIYLQTSLLVENTKEKTVAVSHQKMIMEEIRSWSILTDAAIADKNWQSWLVEKEGANGLLSNEQAIVTSQNWVVDFPTSPRRVVVKITWKGVRGDSEMILVGGFV